MRLLFEKGKQRGLIKAEKEKRVLTWKQFASELSMKQGKLMTFFTEERMVDDLTFDKLILKQDYEKFIIKKLKDNWGRSKGGSNSRGNLKDIKIPEVNYKLAELFGIILGDGHISKIKRNKVGVYNVAITGDALGDRAYLVDFVKPLLEKLFGIKSRIRKLKSNAIQVVVDSKRLVDFLEEKGIKSGNKIRNNSGIPDWIKKDDHLLAACLRGLYDTDGSFYKLTNQNSYQVHFRNNNVKLLEDVRKGLLKLGIFPSRIIGETAIVITKKNEIEKFYKSVGFSNFKHLKKIKKLF